MFTVVETPSFTRLWPDYWDEDERGEFVAWLAGNPEAGDIVRGSGGCRKVRWSRAGTGKSGGVRVIYFNRLSNGEIWLLTIYSKGARDSIPGNVLSKLKESMAKMTEKDLLKRDAKRNIGNELLQAVQEMKAGKVGHVHRVAMSAVTAARTSAGISQSEFATLLGVSPRTLQEWEQGRRQPSGAARTLLAIAARHPQVLREILDT